MEPLKPFSYSFVICIDIVHQAVGYESSKWLMFSGHPPSRGTGMVLQLIAAIRTVADCIISSSTDIWLPGLCLNGDHFATNTHVAVHWKQAKY